MSLVTSLSVGLSLSVDAFAASVAQGTARPETRWLKALAIAACFGAFAGGFLLLGWLISHAAGTLLHAVDHWLAFCLLGLIGGKMIRDARRAPRRPRETHWRSWLVLALSTSIDAAAVGMTVIVMGLPVFQTAALVGASSFTLTLLGIRLGGWSHQSLAGHAEWLGGAVLIALGIKILVGHTLLA